MCQALPFAAVADRIRALGVPDALAEAFWAVAKGNITVLDDLAQWWTLFRDGAEPLVDPEDDAISWRRRWRCCRRGPGRTATWGEWTDGGEGGDGPQGQGAVPPAAPGADRAAMRGRRWPT